MFTIKEMVGKKIWVKLNIFVIEEEARSPLCCHGY